MFSKGGAVIDGASGSADVCTEGHIGWNYTAEEMKLALFILLLILLMFFIVCGCQFWQRIHWKMQSNFGQKRPMPCAPYNRDCSFFVWQTRFIVCLHYNWLIKLRLSEIWKISNEDFEKGFITKKSKILLIAIHTHVFNSFVSFHFLCSKRVNLICKAKLKKGIKHSIFSIFQN